MRWSAWPAPTLSAKERLEQAGALVHRGDILDDLDPGQQGAADSDGVIHLAFQHDVAFAGGNVEAAATADRRAVEAMADMLAGSDRPFVLASGMIGLSIGRFATEDDGLVPTDSDPGQPGRPAVGHRRLYTLSLRGLGIRSSVLRFPPTVHGDGDNGFVATFVGLARDKGVSAYAWVTGPTAGRRSTVPDAAGLARLAVESAPAGSVLHAVGDEGVTFQGDRRGAGPPPRGPDRLPVGH